MLLFEEMVDPVENVMITRDEYADLLAVAEKWEMFRTFFYDNCVHIKEGGASIEGYKVCDAMSILDAKRFKEVFNG